MKLIKINTNHYIIVDDSQIKEGDWMYNPEREPSLLQCIGKGSIRGWKKITHSTQPLERMNHGNYSSNVYLDIEKLSLQEVKELLGEVDVEKKVSEHFKNYWKKEDGTEMSRDEITADMMTNMLMETSAYNAGYTQAIEDNKDKRFSEEDIRKAILFGRNIPAPKSEEDEYWEYEKEFIESLYRAKTKWQVEFIDGKLKLK